MQTIKTRGARLLCLLLAALMALALAACGNGGQSASVPTPSPTPAPLTEEEYKAEVAALETGVSDMLTTMFSLSGGEDEASMRAAAETLRGTVTPFQEFAAITNPPEAYAEAHSKLAEGCSLFASCIESLCDDAIRYIDGEITEEEFNSNDALNEDANQAIELLTEGFTLFETASSGAAASAG